MISRRRAMAAVAGALQQRRPNFVFILADDHAGYVLGCHGNRQAVTPNLDRLASEGTRFARHFCNSPVCTPSRQSFFTGQMPHAAGVTRLPTPLAENKPTIAKQLSGAGYHTAVFGKMHFNRPSRPGLHGFQTMMTEQDIAKAWGGQLPSRPITAESKTKKLPWQPFRDPARVWLNADKLPYPRHYEEMRGTFTARRALRFLEEHRSDPFAMWVSFPDPHSPFDFPVEDRDRFDAAKFDVPRIGPEDAWQIPLIFRDLSDSDKRGIISAYYTSVNFLDRTIGEVLGAVERLRLADNTLVVYMADHGYSLGQHGRFEKHCSYDPALHVPLIMRWPGRIRRGATVTDMTEHIDVPATILDLLAVDRLPVTHGRSLRPYLEGRRIEPRDHIFSEYLENEEACVRTERWKFVACSGRRERGDGYKTDNPTPGRWTRLYDLKSDPGEFTDVTKKYPEVVKQMKSLMLARFRQTHPDSEREDRRADAREAVEFYLSPRDV